MSIEGIFIFEISKWDGQTLPIINSDNSFTKLESSQKDNQVTVQFSFIDNGATDDGLNFYQTGFSEKNVTIIQWGGIPLSRNSLIPQYQPGSDNATNQLTYNGIFRQFNGKIVTKDTPMILNNTNLQSCFLGVVIESKDYGNIGDWDTSKVTNMSYMFSAGDGTKYLESNFNQPIGDWDTQNVTMMSAMFNGASQFNQPIGEWDTSKVTTMRGMFNRASQFNQPIGYWNTQNVTDMLGMFAAFNRTKSKYLESNFKQSIGDWDTQNVTDMSYMFKGTSKFNQPIGDWNTSNVTKMQEMFSGASQFESDIRRWTVIKSTNLKSMFQEAKRFKRKYRVGDTPRYTFFNQNQKLALTTIQKFLSISGI